MVPSRYTVIPTRMHKTTQASCRLLCASLSLPTVLVACGPGDRSTGQPSDSPASPPFSHVLMISVDGLRSDALLALPRQAEHGFRRLLSPSESTSTFNARTDADWTITLPNHTDMLTGLPVEDSSGPAGVTGHHWRENGIPQAEQTLHSTAGRYISSVFDVAHDHGFHTALIAEKAKFILYDRTWNDVHGAPDLVAPDNGKDKIDFALYPADDDHRLLPAEAADAALRELAAAPQSLVFLHFAEPDFAGHEFGWDLTSESQYLQAVIQVDAQLARILDGIAQTPTLAGNTAIILTSDHGGGVPHLSHTKPQFWVNYIIPFIIWTGDARASGDLYENNAATRQDPSLWAPPTQTDDLPPIRNGDMGNVALQLLGLPAIKDSCFNADQRLRLNPVPEPSR